MYSLLIIVCSVTLGDSIWTDKYNTIWHSPGVGQWENLPIGNGDFVANVWLSSTDDLLPPNELSVTPCSTGSHNHQLWSYDATTKLLQNQNQCVTATGNSNPTQTADCDASNTDLQWIYNSDKEFVSVSKNTCLDIYGGAAGIASVDEYHCTEETNQQWTFDGTTKQIKSVRFPTECLTALSSAPINGSTYDLWFAFGKSDSYDLTGERLKMTQLKISFDPPITNDNSFQESLFLSNATVIIQDDTYFIKVFIDRNENTLNVQSATINDIQYSITASIQSWRAAPNFNPGKATGQAFCSGRATQRVPLMNDVLSGNGCSQSVNEAAQTIFYHRNNYENNGESEWNYNLKLQGMESVAARFKDPYLNGTFGGVLYLSEGRRTNVKGAVSAVNVKSSILTFQVLSKQTASLGEWLNELCSQSEGYMAQSIERHEKVHNVAWSEFWNRSQIDITNANNSTLFLVSQLYNEQRYLDALDGYASSNRSIKFNGQSFWIDTGNGPDFKPWGSGYWWQNTRQPYYNTIVAGDIDMNVAFYNHYLNQIPLLKERNLIWLNHSGVFFGETAMFNGLFQEATYGYDCGANPDQLLNVIPWLRYHWVGGLELINLLLDEYDFFQNENIITEYALPVSDAVLTHFYEQFTEIDGTTHRVIMYPSQGLETWQCPNKPPEPKNCVTNPTEQIAGLQVVTQRLLDLPSAFGTATERQLWQNVLTKFPDYALMKAKDGSTSIIAPGEKLPPQTSNSENTELYTVHPFRIYMSYKSNLTLALNTYKHRRFPCNDGWCQDIVDAAMLGLVDEASSMVIQRAQSSKGGLKWKWSGYTGHFQDFEPSLDHLDFMRTAMHYMLMQNDFQTKQIYLFPAWPCDWSGTFKLHAINNTVITLDYDGVHKKINSMTVVPTSRTNDVRFVNCVSNKYDL